MKAELSLINTMDRHFFGKSLSQWAAEQAKNPKSVSAIKLIESSIDDFNKHFEIVSRALKNGSNTLERVPDEDLFIKIVKPSTIEDSFGPSF